MAQTDSSDPSIWETRTQKALQQWRDGGAENPFVGTLLYRQALAAGATAPSAITRRLVEDALAVLRAGHPGDADLVERRFLRAQTIEQAARELGFAESTLYPKQKQAIQRLAATLAGMEDALRAARRARFDQRSGAPKQVELIGVASHVAALSPIVADHGPPWIIAIEGIGGIGKTTLADALARHLTAHVGFDDFAWVSAQPAILDLGGGIRAVTRPALTAAGLVDALLHQLLPEAMGSYLSGEEKALTLLRDVLKKSPHLVVIDNLESVTDLEALLPTVRDLAEPSKFILTSRKRLLGERSIYSFLVPELSEEQAFTLVRQEARLRNLPELADASDAELTPIYAAVGGHPLALLLVVGQTHIHALHVVLRQLTGAVGAPVESLYAYIYQHAWQSLDEISQRVLLAMPLVNIHGDDLEYIAAVSAVAPNETAEALRKLVMLNLVVGLGGELHQRRYTIHGLTRSFLQEQVARWGV